MWGAGFGFRCAIARIRPVVAKSYRPSQQETRVGFFNSGETHTRSLIKAISWRVAASVDTFIISFIITGRISLAGTIASVEVVTKIGLYYLHEQAWATIPWGQRR